MAWTHGIGTVGSGNPVEAGECLSSIAVREGIFWKDLWNDAANSDLKDYRMHPNILLPGDKVTIPKKAQKNVPKKDDKRHRMRAKGVPGILRLRFTKFGQPRKGDAYRLEVDGYVSQGGKLNKDGAFDAQIWPGAAEAMVLLGKDQDSLDEEVAFKLGWIAPANEPRGIQARLWNLNYYHGPLSDDFDDDTERALLRFMQKNAIGDAHEEDLDDLEWDNLTAHQQDTIYAVVKAHGC